MLRPGWKPSSFDLAAESERHGQAAHAGAGLRTCLHPERENCYSLQRHEIHHLNIAGQWGHDLDAVDVATNTLGDLAVQLRLDYGQEADCEYGLAQRFDFGAARSATDC